MYYDVWKELLHLGLGGAWAAPWAEGLGGSLGGLFWAWAEAWARTHEIQFSRRGRQEFRYDAAGPLVNGAKSSLSAWNRSPPQS